MQTRQTLRQSNLLHQLYLCGRRDNMNVITSTQSFKAMANVIRKHIKGLYCFRLRNQLELDAVLEEVSALSDKKALLSMYDLATKTQFSFLFMQLHDTRY